jgi:NitT/TauT family transport system permease protein
MYSRWLAWIAAAGVLTVWELLVRLLSIPTLLLPPPSAIVAVFLSDQARLLAINAVPTAIQAITGFLFAALLGVVIAALLSYSKLFKEALYPYLIAFQVIPKIALAPLFVLWLGIGFLSRFAFVTFMCFFPIVVAFTSGLQQASPETVRMCRAFGGSKAQTFLHIRLPFAVDYLFAGLKIAATMSMIGVVVGEFITADRGLGYLILWAASRSDTALVIAAVLILCLIGLALYAAVVACEWSVQRRMTKA